MDDALLDSHQPTEAVRRRAERRGIDLDALRRSRPQEYKMLNAVDLLEISPDLEARVGEVFFAVAPGHDLFSLPGAGRLRLLAFPPPGRDALARFHAGLERLVETPDLATRHVYFREVKDRRGERRELATPRRADAWLGEETLVGPFADASAAHAFGRRKVMGEGALTYDVVSYRGAWFCDVFRADGV